MAVHQDTDETPIDDPANWVYNDDGSIFVDPAGRLKDKNDRGFSLPKLPRDREYARLAIFNMINNILKTDELPAAKETYDRLRAAGAGDLEARSLLAECWAHEMHEISQMPDITESGDTRLIARLNALQPFPRDQSGNVKR
jgi:hypothetical protein